MSAFSPHTYSWPPLMAKDLVRFCSLEKILGKFLYDILQRTLPALPSPIQTIQFSLLGGLQLD